MKYFITILCIVSLAGCTLFDSETVISKRNDAALQVIIELEGSLQNASWSPDSIRIVFNRFRDGYNTGVSDLFIYNTETEILTELLADGSHNLTAPGNAWHRSNGRIVFSSDKNGHSELYIISPDSMDKDIVQLTNRVSSSATYGGFTYSGDVSFVSRDSLNEGTGRIMTVTGAYGAGSYQTLSSLTLDCDRPSWSTVSDQVLYECIDGNQTDLWIKVNGGFASRNITSSPNKSETGAIWTKDGLSILYSDKNSSNIFAIDINTGALNALTSYNGYSGRPALSPDSTTLVFESAKNNNTGSSGATLWILENITY